MKNQSILTKPSIITIPNITNSDIEFLILTEIKTNPGYNDEFKVLNTGFVNYNITSEVNPDWIKVSNSEEEDGFDYEGDLDDFDDSEFDEFEDDVDDYDDDDDFDEDEDVEDNISEDEKYIENDTFKLDNEDDDDDLDEDIFND